MKKNDQKVEIIFESRDGNFIDEPDSRPFNNVALTVRGQEGDGSGIESIPQTATMIKLGNNKWQSKGKIKFQYFFPRRQKVFVCLSQENFNIEIKGCFLLADIFQNAEKTKGCTIVLRSNNCIYSCSLKVRGVEIFDANEVGVYMNWKANNLVDKGSFFSGVTNPYLRFLKGYPNGAVHEVVRTETVVKSLCPDWQPTYQKISKLFDSSMLLPFVKVECWHDSQKGDDNLDEFIGEVRLEYRDIVEYVGEEPKILIMKDPVTKEHLGNLVLSEVEIDHPITFLADIERGLSLTYTTARCLTGEVSGDTMAFITHIERKLFQVLQPYILEQNHQKAFQVYGIGTNEFYSSMITNQSESEAESEGGRSQSTGYTEVRLTGVQNQVGSFERKTAQTEIMDTFYGVDEEGPKRERSRGGAADSFQGTVEVTPLLQEIFTKPEKSTYHVVVLLATKVFHDFKHFLEEIMEKDKYPFSFLVIGIGDQDFSKFEILNQDNLGGVTDRSLTKFVHCPSLESLQTSVWMDRLLEVVPEQFLELMNILSRYSDALGSQCVSE